MKELRPLKLQFLKLSVNPKPLSKLQVVKDLVNVYLTQESIINNFEKVFGYRNETLSIRFYNYLAEGYKGVRIYIPTFIIKLIGLIDAKPLQMNYFGFKLLDSDLNGFVYASDIADIIQNALEYCPEANVEKVYPTLVGPTFQRSHSDKRCRCALYQEMVALFNTFYQINKRNSIVKQPIDFPLFCDTVKISVLAVEFRDKLLGLQGLPRLLGHSNQPMTNGSYINPSHAAVYLEVVTYVDSVNSMRESLMKQIQRELSNENILERHCKEEVK